MGYNVCKTAEPAGFSEDKMRDNQGAMVGLLEEEDSSQFIYRLPE